MGNIVTSHAAGPGSIPGRVNFLLEVFFSGFSFSPKTNVRYLGHIRPRLSYGHHVSSKPYNIRLWKTTVFDYSCGTWLSLNNKTTITADSFIEGHRTKWDLICWILGAWGLKLSSALRGLKSCYNAIYWILAMSTGFETLPKPGNNKKCVFIINFREISLKL